MLRVPGGEVFPVPGSGPPLGVGHESKSLPRSLEVLQKADAPGERLEHLGRGEAHGVQDSGRVQGGVARGRQDLPHVAHGVLPNVRPFRGVVSESCRQDVRAVMVDPECFEASRCRRDEAELTEVTVLDPEQPAVERAIGPQRFTDIQKNSHAPQLITASATAAGPYRGWWGDGSRQDVSAPAGLDRNPDPVRSRAIDARWAFGDRPPGIRAPCVLSACEGPGLSLDEADRLVAGLSYCRLVDGRDQPEPAGVVVFAFVLPRPGEVRLDDEIHQEIERVDTHPGPQMGPLEVDVPAQPFTGDRV